MADKRYTFAFVFPMASGHLNPSLPMARMLLEEGHQVHYLCREPMREAIEGCGASFSSAVDEETELYDGREQDFFGCLEALKTEHGLQEEPMLYAMMKLMPIQMELQLPGLLRWLQKIRADAVVYCPLVSREAAYAAQILGLPSVSLLTTAGPGSMVTSMEGLLRMMGASLEDARVTLNGFQPVQQCVARMKARWGIHADVTESLRTMGFNRVFAMSAVTLVTTCEELQDPLPSELGEKYRVEAARFVAVGPLLDQAGATRAAGHKLKTQKSTDSQQQSEASELLESVKAAKAAGRRVIFASMGTVITGDSLDFGWDVKLQNNSGQRKGLTGKQLCQAAWSGVFDAFGDSEALLVVSVGPQPDALEGLDVPSNALCRASVPQVDLLQAGVDLFLTHGGQNSFTESLSAGVPVVVCPGFGDQPVNAEKAVELGVGLQVPRPTPEGDAEEAAAIAGYRADVRQALLRVAAEPPFAERSGCFAKALRAGGVPRAVQLTLQAVEDAKAKARLPALLGAPHPTAGLKPACVQAAGLVGA
ncbi:unnamed protein product [Effrenium voratum]|uniref:Glycosyltransferase n=1 Tax=Effrenium voratum TaxID=2562239 RepID=A0AA36IWK4_9DINO|nr:unnamed protein product [Effrenium voratum]CAJ1457117.1 unnamed protein product [Effrenium voratum]